MRSLCGFGPLAVRQECSPIATQKPKERLGVGATVRTELTRSEGSECLLRLFRATGLHEAERPVETRLDGEQMRSPSGFAQDVARATRVRTKLPCGLLTMR